jgi:hypothetical protein
MFVGNTWELSKKVGNDKKRLNNEEKGQNG